MAEKVELDQEAKLLAKYGGLKPKKKTGLMAQDHKFFDSADWSMQQQQQQQQPAIRHGDRAEEAEGATPNSSTRPSYELTRQDADDDVLGRTESLEVRLAEMQRARSRRGSLEMRHGAPRPKLAP